jgi:hypothetical protein
VPRACGRCHSLWELSSGTRGQRSFTWRPTALRLLRPRCSDSAHICRSALDPAHRTRAQNVGRWTSSGAPYRHIERARNRSPDLVRVRMGIVSSFRARLWAGAVWQLDGGTGHEFCGRGSPEQRDRSSIVDACATAPCPVVRQMPPRAPRSCRCNTGGLGEFCMVSALELLVARG